MNREDLIQELATQDITDNYFKRVLEFADSLASAKDFESWQRGEILKENLIENSPA